MNDRVILITGCSSGIGHCAAHGLQARGWRVFATARQPADVEPACGPKGWKVYPGCVRRHVDSGCSRGGPGADRWTTGCTVQQRRYGQPGAVEDVSREALREQFETNVLGAHELTRQVIPVMRRQGSGRIIYNSSVLGLVAFSLPRALMSPANLRWKD